MARKRYLSPTSINTYLRCPRKYYYRYIKGMKEKPSIYLVRGIAVHEALARFFDQCYFNIHDNERSKGYLKALFQDAWMKQNATIEKLGLDPNVIQKYYDESVEMLRNWSLRLHKKSIKESEKPKTEIKLFSQKYNVMGVIDAVYEKDGKAILIDYKTSKSDKITRDIKVQMGIYAVLYREKSGKYPSMIGIDFLKTGTRKFFKVSDVLINYAKKLCREIAIRTSSKQVADYPCRCGGWCEKDFVFDNENTSN